MYIDIQHTAGMEIEEVRLNINKVIAKFVALKKAIQTELENPTDGREAVSASDAVDKIMNSPAVWKTHVRKILTENRGYLRDSETVEGVLDCLGLIGWDYLNPDIYGFLIRSYALRSLEQQLAEYRKDLDDFMDETPITTFSNIVGEDMEKEIPKGFKKLVTRHKWTPPVYLRHVEMFRRRVAEKYQLQEHVVFLVQCGIKSVIITLLVPAVIESELPSATTPEFLLEDNIMTMEYNGKLSVQVCKYNQSSSTKRY